MKRFCIIGGLIIFLGGGSLALTAHDLEVTGNAALAGNLTLGSKILTARSVSLGANVTAVSSTQSAGSGLTSFSGDREFSGINAGGNAFEFSGEELIISMKSERSW